MSTLEKYFNEMNFEFNGKSAIGIDVLSGDLWIYSDALIKGCEKNYNFFGYVCRQMFTVLEKHIKAGEEDAQEIIEEMKKATCSLSSFNDKLAKLIIVCKKNFKKDKEYVLASEIVYLLNMAKDSAFAMLSDASSVINASVLRYSKHSNDIYSLLAFLCNDEYLEKYKCINAELDDVNSMSKKELSNIVTLADCAAKTTEAA